MIANSQYQPEAQDPLGLTRAQWQANPRQADPAATLFDTRKTVDQQQGGVAVEQRLGADTTLRVTGYGGQRAVGQYLALAGVGADLVGRRDRPRSRLRRRRRAARSGAALSPAGR